MRALTPGECRSLVEMLPANRWGTRELVGRHLPARAVEAAEGVIIGATCDGGPDGSSSEAWCRKRPAESEGTSAHDAERESDLHGDVRRPGNRPETCVCELVG
mmetsp:Transcript_46681/g.108472  ORF Transcript_46681/g.108472 Transcript_46681/m.108472 type:complete len:103 (+) Transcript_46681:874-1182(+)